MYVCMYVSMYVCMYVCAYVCMYACIYLIGLQELGQLDRKYKKDQKLDLMHIAICKLLAPYGYYEFDYIDEDGWPHYKTLSELPHLKSEEQSVLMTEAVVNYFVKTAYIR